jgi:putative ABC transport system substrate-binding protein
MRRREFITIVGGAAVWPLAATAQQPARTPTVEMRAAGTPASHGKWVAALVARLRELGWVEGRNIAIEYRWAEGRDERVAEFAAEFVRLNADVIVSSSNQAIKTVMRRRKFRSSRLR